LRLYYTKYMRANKLFKRSKAKDGEGRQVKIKHILVPEEVADELALYKDAYAACLDVRVTYEQMFRRWLDNIGRIDPDIPGVVESIRVSRKEFNEKMAADLGMTAEQLEANHRDFNPADPELEPWKLKYMFTRDGEELEAFPGDQAAFYTNYKGKNTGMSAMLSDGWILINEVGSEISWSQAFEINRLMKEHKDDH